MQECGQTNNKYLYIYVDCVQFVVSTIVASVDPSTVQFGLRAIFHFSICPESCLCALLNHFSLLNATHAVFDIHFSLYFANRSCRNHLCKQTYFMRTKSVFCWLTSTVCSSVNMDVLICEFHQLAKVVHNFLQTSDSRI